MEKNAEILLEVSQVEEVFEAKVMRQGCVS